MAEENVKTYSRPTIVVFRTGRLGDMVVALPALALIRRRHPRHTIVLATTFSARGEVRSAASTYAGSYPPWFAWICPKYVDHIVWIRDWRDILENRKLFRSVSKQCEMVYVLPYHGERDWDSLKKRLWLRLHGVGPIIGNKRADVAASRPASISAQVWAPWIAAHGLLRMPASEDLLYNPLIEVSQSAKFRAEEELKNYLSARRTIISLFAGGTHAFKRWPISNFAEVCCKLSARHQVGFVLLGSAADAVVHSNLIEALPRSVSITNLTGALSLDETAAVLVKSRMFVGNDGGLMHVAAALGVKTVGILSGVHKRGVWDPSGPNGFAIAFSEVHCFGCGTETYCKMGDSRCVTNIKPSDVIERCESILPSAREEA